jgi:protein-L-isoaspartate O-methyltransferase
VTPAELALLVGEPGQALLTRLSDHRAEHDLRVATALRAEGHDAAAVAAVLTQVRLRQRARPRFGSDADAMLWTPAGLEQATRPAVAAHRARRLADSAVRRVADLCCGVGADAIAFARAGIDVLAVEIDPGTAATAAANAELLGLADRIEVRCTDVRDVDPIAEGCDAVFIDPARRAGRRRTFDPEGYLPPFSFVVELARRVPATVAKVAPGIPHDLVPSGVEAEWVSDGGEVKEACLWHGTLARPAVRRRATLLPSGATLTNTRIEPPPVGPVGRWLIEPDGAVIRAGLVAEVADQVDGRLLDSKIAYVTCDVEPLTPYGRTFEVLAEIPFARKRMRAELRSRGYGDIVVKKRGIAVVPEELRRELQLTGDGPTATVVLTRVGARPLALLVAPPPLKPSSG